MDYKYAYLLGNILIAFPVWLFLFLKRKDTRKEMLIISLLFGVLGPISEFWFHQDYWKPEIFMGWIVGMEDCLYGFFAGGIGSVIYEEIYGERFSQRISRKNHFLWFLVPLSGLAFLRLHSGVHSPCIGNPLFS